MSVEFLFCGTELANPIGVLLGDGRMERIDQLNI